ncbi:uncharacterized protein LOC119651990 isoform X1 [Hermetia illucens]|uniref:uncharacterized protein LOC119651990 isoform X1 n=1 Tax=Hermetia illucens TaxID=343691 RepID=UPI0018CC6E07|nr:uncharacterized protein LOC119651990 isoform X1 [Hermetia illucens]
MKIFLLSLLVIGTLAKDKIKDKGIIHDLLYKDTNVLNFGDVCKLKIHQRLSTLNVDLTQRHLIDEILVNVDRCVTSCTDDYKIGKDVAKYRYCVGNLMAITLGQVDFLERNNLLNNVGELDNLVNRLRQCDVFFRDTDFMNTNRNLDWRLNQATNVWGINRNLGTFGTDRDLITNRDLVNRDYTTGRGTDKLFDTNINKGVGGLDRGDTYGRGVFQGDLTGRSDVYGRGNIYGRDDITGRGVGGLKTGGIGGVDNDWNKDRTYGRYQRSLNYDNRLDTTGNDLGVVGWYRVIYGVIGDDDRDTVNYGNDNVYGVNRYDKDIYGRQGILGRDRQNYGVRGYDLNVDRDITGHRNWNQLVTGGERDIYGRRTGAYNTDYNLNTQGRTYYDNKYGLGGRDRGIDNLVY